MSDINHLVYGILQFLNQQKDVLPPDAAESLEVAVQCLETAYGLNSVDANLSAEYPLPSTLPTIFRRGLDTFPKPEPVTVNLAASTASAPPAATGSTSDERELAESHKTQGNECMKKEEYTKALDWYSQAIKVDSSNSVYYCNRAAAYSKLENHVEALADCVRALELDPSYSKAYGRKGLAHSALNQHADAKECFKKALELDPENGSYKQNLEIADQKMREGGAPPGMGPMLGGLNLQGMDFTSLLANPALMNMATNMMANPQMQQMMSGLLTGAGAQQEGPQGMGSLLQAGQQLAQQMQESNPDLVEQLRTQMQNPPDTEPDAST